MREFTGFKSIHSMVVTLSTAVHSLFRTYSARPITVGNGGEVILGRIKYDLRLAKTKSFQSTSNSFNENNENSKNKKRVKTLQKKLREINVLEKRVLQGIALEINQREKIATKVSILTELAMYEQV